MELLRVAGATVNQTPLDFNGNRDRIITLIESAKAGGVELLCLPELCLTGYGCEDTFFSLATAAAAEAALIEILPHTRGITVLLGLPHVYYGALYNCAVMVQDGAILGLNAKRVLPREGVHYEPRWFRPWPFGKVVDTVLAGKRVPLGDIRYRFGSLGVAVEICEEAWDSVPASAAHADAVQLVLNPSASHFALSKYAKREHLVANSSRSLRVSYVYTNLLGLEAGRIIYDGGVLIAEAGEIVTRGARFGFHDGELTCRDINPELASLNKLTGKPVREPEAKGPGTASGDDAIRAEVVARDPRDVRRSSGQPAVTKSTQQVSRCATSSYRPLTRHEEFLFAEMLGLFDYMRKTRSKGYVVSLSGGCDSACCAVLVAQMLAASVAALGLEATCARLHLPKPHQGTGVKELIASALVCIYQSTAHSGPVTHSAAQALAEELGATWYDASVQPMVEAYVKAAEGLLQRPLTWAADDLSLQNIQARARAPLAWLIANVRQSILLTTSNRSEAAVGYATMDGDTAGGLAPLAGIDKLFLREWLRWAEHSCVDGLGHIAALAAVNAQAPTAELRPPSATQRDEDDLMPYAILERIERYLVRDHLGADDILATLRFDFPQIEPKVLTGYLNKFFALWSRNQWKRERYAPAFHIDDESLDPKTWCRFPILSTPFQVGDGGGMRKSSVK
ncbi:MAG: NAD+ synthetase [Deltaproteobacteria bacterium]|nr:NAD+ synthetase [Deltaproteobacteria bacterium]